jgi:predicted HicB family RNase H-like nuclease
MIYKGYQAIVEFDEEDRLFVGRVINTRDVIAFDGASVDELDQVFHAVIDEYLDDCSATGKDPDKPFSGRFNLRISPDLHRLAATNAERQGISLNTFVENALNAFLLTESQPSSKSAALIEFPSQSARKTSKMAASDRTTGIVEGRGKSASKTAPKSPRKTTRNALR